jgi:hypothetical protein
LLHCPSKATPRGRSPLPLPYSPQTATLLHCKIVDAMSSNTLKQRKSEPIPIPVPDLGPGSKEATKEPHPAGRVKHGGFVQLLRMLVFAAWFNACCTCICATQFLGSWLYLANKDYYYAYMSLTKQSFGIVITTITQWFSPTRVRISGDKSVRGQLGRTGDGRLRTDFPERLVLIANHQLYTDWLYLWWVAYTGRMHGHIYIILKEALKYVPLIGTGMMFYGFVFMSRKWQSDKPRLQHRLQKLKSQHSLIRVQGLGSYVAPYLPRGN